MESVDPVNLADVKKSFSRPIEYRAILERLARRNIFAITSFIFGMDNDTPGVAKRTLAEIQSWPPGLPIFGQLTPYPATPLYNRLEKAGRLARPRHWMDFAPFEMAHQPLKMTIPEVRMEIDRAWSSSYSPERNAQAIDSISDKPVGYRIYHLVARLLFRSIYFPGGGKWSWVKTVFLNRRAIYSVVSGAFATWGLRWAFKRQASVQDGGRVPAEPSTGIAPMRHPRESDTVDSIGVVAEGRLGRPDLPRRS
jgi:hypothetical protein